MSSSEKVDSENRYSDFNIISLPYPGCEFFKLFREFNYSAQMLKFDWDQSYCDATLNVPNNEIVQSLEIEWRDYRTWPLVMMTQNYFKLLLRYLEVLYHYYYYLKKQKILFFSNVGASKKHPDSLYQRMGSHPALYLNASLKPVGGWCNSQDFERCTNPISNHRL